MHSRYLPEIAIHLSAVCKNVCTLLSKQGYRSYLVGGAVRDILCGIKPTDFDIVTNARFEAIQPLFSNGQVLPSSYRVLQIKDADGNIDLSSLHSQDAGRHGNPRDSLLTNSIQVDVARRDFTINSLYYDLERNELIDFHHGLADIANKKIRLLGDPSVRFYEDPRLMLRALRFSCKLDFEITKSTAKAIINSASLLPSIGASRLIPELMRHLLSGNAIYSMQTVCAYGLHSGFLPYLHEELNASAQSSFLRQALPVLDTLEPQNVSVSSSLILTILLWPQLRQISLSSQRDRSGALSDKGNPKEDLLRPDWLFPSLWQEILEICSTQPLFETCEASAFSVLCAHKRRRAGFSLLQLRAKSGEIEPSVIKWWANKFGLSYEPLA